MAMAYQLSIFAENKPGRIERTTRILKEADINIRNINIASAGEYGVIQLLVDNPEKGYKALKEANIPVSKKEIIAVYMQDRPGGLYEITRVLSEKGINIEDASGFILQEKSEAIFVIEVEKIPQAVSVLEDAGFKILSEAEIYSL
jgi:hypothetical protein